MSAVASLAIYWLSRSLTRRNIVDASGRPIPPGPWRRYASLRTYPERVLHRWTKIYGHIYSIFMGDQLVIVVAHPQVAQDLLVDKGSIFSSRKGYFTKDETLLHHLSITGSPYNQTW